MKLVDLKPTKLVPTWHNGRVGLSVVARSLDRCLVSKVSLYTLSLSRTWVEYPFISDHALLFLFKRRNPPFTERFLLSSIRNGYRTLNSIIWFTHYGKIPDFWWRVTNNIGLCGS